jgi:chorismate synthase
MSVLETALGALEIRELSGLNELASAEQLQLDVWGADTIPEGRELLLAAQHAGGLVAGALDSAANLAGMVFAFPSRDPAVQHSHRLAVHPRWRGQAIGAALKWFQRDWCRHRAIHFVEWTVDPLRMPNAELNARILGATTDTYLLDYYGAMQGIDAGLPSDRFYMRWDLDSQRVCTLAAALPADGCAPGIPEANTVVNGRPVELRLDIDAPALLVNIPADFVRLSASDRLLAAAWRQHTRQLFQAYFSRGYAVSGFRTANGPAYLLERKTPR